MRKISAGVINIDIHPHEKAGVYAELLRSLCKRKETYWGERSLVIRGFEGDGQLLAGNIITFLDIDPDQPWFDPEAVEKADEEATEAAKLAVAKIKPSMQSFKAALVETPDAHCLIVETRNELGQSLSIGAVEEALRRLAVSALDDDAPVAVEFSVLSSAAAVGKLLAKRDIKKLRIVVAMPNSDDGKEEDDAVRDWLAKRRATRQELILTKPVPDSGGIQADDEMHRLARVAARHGRVEVTHGTRGATKVESTTDRPVLESAEPKTGESYSTVFKILVKRLVDRMRAS